MRSLEMQYNRFGSRGRDPIIIQIAPGYQYRQGQQQAAPNPSPSQGYLIEGKLIPLREKTANQTAVNATDRPKIVPLQYDDTGWKSSERKPGESKTQYGYVQGYSQCDPYGSYSSGGYGQQCPPSYGGGFGGGGYGGGGFGMDPSRPIIPGSGSPGTGGGDIPNFQPTQPTEPQKLELDYDKLADALLPKMAEDDRFRGIDGKPGKPGPAGSQGPAGPAAHVTQTQLTAMSAAILNQMAGDARFKGSQGPRGSQGEITPEQIAELTEEIKRGLSRRVLVVDGKEGEVLADETYAFDKPFVFDVTKIRRKAKTQRTN